MPDGTYRHIPRPACRSPGQPAAPVPLPWSRPREGGGAWTWLASLQTSAGPQGFASLAAAASRGPAPLGWESENIIVTSVKGKNSVTATGENYVIAKGENNVTAKGEKSVTAMREHHHQ